MAPADRRRGRRKKRIARRRQARRALESILDAEEQADEAETPDTITRADMEQAGAAGIINPASLEIFLVWYAMGGQQRTITIRDAIDMPADLRADFGYLFGELARLRRRRRRRKAKERERRQEPSP